MKKTSIVILAVCVFTGMHTMAQSIQEGMNHLYAKRNQSAKTTFEKMLAANPNNLEATYWLGQTFIAMDDAKGARSVYEKALMTNGNAPLLLVGMGHVELLEKKKNESRQRFETAITLSRSKKGDDPVVLNAIGRANVDTGDVAYAIEKLKIAGDRDPKNPDIFLNLGNAYRKGHEGGQSITAYQKALAINPNFAVAYYRIAQLYETQQNWEIYLQNLNDAIAKDPKFAPAYYELYYYNLLKSNFDAASGFAAKFIANTDPDVQNDYLKVQTDFFMKKYDDAISGAKAIIAAAGEKTNAKTYKLLAYSYLGKGDSITAKQYIDQFFAKVRGEDIIGEDYILKADIYAGQPNNTDPNVVRDSYLKAASMDSVLDKKMKLLQQGVDRFRTSGKKVAEAELRMAMYDLKPNKNPAELFFIGLPFYQGQAYQRADSLFKMYATAFPDSVYGHYWSAQSNFALDTTMLVEPFVTNMVTGYQKTLDLALTNPRFKSQGIASSKMLAGYYNNMKKDKDSAIVYLQKGLQVDPTNASITELLNILQKPPAKQATPPAKQTTPPKTPPKKSATGKNKSQAMKAGLV